MKRMPVRTLEPGTNGYVLKTSGGVAVWVPAAAVATDAIWDAKGDLAVGSGADAASKLGVGSDGQILTADSTQTLGVKWAAAAAGFADPTTTKGDLIARGASSTTRLAVGSDAQVLTADSTQTLGVRWATPSSGSTVKDRRWSVGASETSIDEFNDSSLDAAWTRVDGTGAASGNLTWVEDADVLSGMNVGGDSAAAFHGMVRPIGTSMVAGDAFVTAMRFLYPVQTNYAIAGICVADGSTFGAGNQVQIDAYTTSTDLKVTVDLKGRTNWTADSVSTIMTTLPPGSTLFLRLVMTATNTWRADWSFDGVQWLKGATISKTITPTQVGFACSSNGTSTKHIASYEFLRRVSGVS